MKARSVSALPAVVVLVVVLAGAGGAAAQESPSTSTPSTSSATETTSASSETSSSLATSSSETGAAEQDVSCPAVHMLLAPGTSETSRWAEPNSDTHGFLSMNVAQPVMNAVNENAGGDLSGGFAKLLNLPEGMAGPLADKALSGLQGGLENGRKGQRLSRTYVTYPSTVGGVQPPGQTALPENAGDTTAYEDSMSEGVSMTEDLMATIHDKCPDTKLFLTGFSQGSEVMDQVARRVGAGETAVDPDVIAGVSMFANPPREGGTPLQPEGAASLGPVPGTSGENVQAAVTGLDRLPTPNAGGLSTDKTGIDGYGALSDRVVSWCLPGDYVCGLPVESELVADVVSQLEGMSLGDPAEALRKLAEIMKRATAVGDLTDVANFDFGGLGFSTRPDGRAETPVLEDRVMKATATTDDSNSGAASIETTTATTSTEASASSEASTPTSTGGEDATSTDESTAAEQTDTSAPASTSKVEELAEQTSVASEPSQIPGEETTAEEPPAPAPAPAPGVPPLPGLPPLPPLPTPEQAAQTLVGVAAGVGGMALGAGITVAERAITPENLAQLAIAGVTGGPQAAGMVAGAKLSESAMTLLEPGSASGYARQTLQILEDNGIAVPDQVELAVSLTAWLSMSEHNAYGERPALPDGRTPADATTDWVEAIVADLTADKDNALAAPERPALGGADALEAVDFDTDAAQTGVDGLSRAVSSAKKTTTTSSSDSSSSTTNQTTSHSSTPQNTTTEPAATTSQSATETTTSTSNSEGHDQ